MNWKKDPNVTIGLAVGLGVCILIIAFLLLRGGKSQEPDPEKMMMGQQIHDLHRQLQSQRAAVPQESRVEGSKPTVVLFYSNGCGHCKHMMDDWKQAAQVINQSGVVQALALEASENMEDMRKQNIPGFPEVRFYPNGYPSENFMSYSGDRSAESLVNFAKSGGQSS